MQATDMSGMRIGHVLVCEANGSLRNQRLWLCKCSCGNERTYSGVYLRKAIREGYKVSCGCKKSESSARNGRKNKTHGFSTGRTKKLYDVHRQMMRRCYSEDSKDYKNYGGRGIKVCHEWKTLGGFISWAHQNGYRPKMTIERIDVNDDYRPSNCTWTPNRRQSMNRRITRKFTINGETKTLSEWCQICGVLYTTARGRLRAGKTILESLTPIR